MLARFIWIAVFTVCFFGITVVSAQSPDTNQAARNAQMQADFEFVDKIGSPKAYQAFIDTYRSGDLVEAARQRRDASSSGRPDSGDREPPQKRIRM